MRNADFRPFNIQMIRVCVILQSVLFTNENAQIYLKLAHTQNVNAQSK